MKKFIRQLIFILLSAVSSFSYSQTDSIKGQLTTRFNDYFALDRETIHAQLDKDVFLSDEQIWFKGYVLNRKTRTPFLLTTNVFAVLMDQEGNKIVEHLLFSNSGSFSGNIKLDKKYASGNYYLQFYTNWMNNFNEDESAVYKITIVNTEKPLFPSDKPDYSKINIDFNPQGGSNLVLGIKNVVGIRLSDCSGKPIPVTEGEIVDENGQSITKIFLNNFGYGKFDVIPSTKAYKAVFTINGETVSASLPPAQQNGITLDVNNYATSDKTFITISGNPGYINSLPEKKLFISVNQDDKSILFDMNFVNGLLEQKLAFLNENLFDGVNTMMVFDSKKNVIAQRLIFKYPSEKASATIAPSNKPNFYTGKTDYASANLSIAVLPENSIADKGHSDLFASLLINPYLTEKITNTHYYLDQVSKSKLYEMDLLLMNQKKLKYEWSDISTKTPVQNYEFDYGLTVKGTLNQKQTNIERYKIKLYSFFARLNEITEIDDKNEFYFKYLVAADSTLTNISLLKVPDLNTALPMKISIKVMNAKRSFNHPYVPYSECQPKLEPIEANFPGFLDRDVTHLEEVEVENKNKLTRQMSYGNAMLTGYKITPENNGMDVLNFIQNHGFDVEKSWSGVSIFGRARTSVNGARSQPIVYLDGFKMMSFDELDGLRMEDIDEIYINAHAIVASVNNNMGVIKIYRKKASLYQGKEPKTNVFTFSMEGYQMIYPFVNADYSTKSDQGFENFGVIQWIPNILTDEHGGFSFQLPFTGKQNVKLLIEGITPEGKLISEIKTISVN
jgi:hypothetical protein